MASRHVQTTDRDSGGRGPKEPALWCSMTVFVAIGHKHSRLLRSLQPVQMRSVIFTMPSYLVGVAAGTVVRYEFRHALPELYSVCG
jgi:hypothetical protein